MAKKYDDINEWFGKRLNLQSRDNASKCLQRELDKTGFSIFKPISEHGFFTWTPPSGSYLDLQDVTAQYVKRYIKLDGKPDKIMRTSMMRTPHYFRNLPPLLLENKFPYGSCEFDSLHVASTYRNVDFDTLDFVFSGSTLQMLAKKEEKDPYYVTIIPGTNVALVAKRRDYESNFTEAAFQFERFVVGKGLPSTKEKTFTQHLHVMKVGDYKVLFQAEVDAMDDNGDPVEVTCSNPRYWSTKKMFQLISSGSTKLCTGKRGGMTLLSVNLISLSQAAKDALRYENIRDLEKNIVEGISSIKSELASNVPDSQDEKVFRIAFENNKLVLRAASIRLLPPTKVVRELIKINEVNPDKNE
jgi:hypothetical protein